ncbi:MAG: inositol monophosphatase, partial [Planctomycetes bacterium]|nr:inositol monophosphatase [Planctomycetota bacterium]
MSVDLRPFEDAAVRLAAAAGEELLRRSGRVEAEAKGVRRELVTEADRAAERVVVGGLQRAFPAHGVLAEEGVLTVQGEPSNTSEWLWIVDPLDG